jgi:Transposase DNA-binding/Transposase DDE domain
VAVARTGSQGGVVRPFGTEGVSMACIELDVHAWAEQQFGACTLGDVRRTNRLTRYAAQIAANPDTLTPDQTESWADCKAAYRLIESPSATFQAVSEPHWKLTRARTAGTWLLIGDTTTIDFGLHRKTSGLSAVGNAYGRGFLLHSSLMVSADSEEVAGLAGQLVYYRKAAPKKETNTMRANRPRESEIWGQLIEEIGPPPANVKFVHVFDAGADGFETLARLIHQQVDGVIRVAQKIRRIRVSGEQYRLEDYVSSLPAAGMYDVHVRPSQKRAARSARIEVRFGTVTIPALSPKGAWVREHGVTSLTMQIVEAREMNPPQGIKGIHWMLYTTLPVATMEDAARVIGYYSKRSLIEEFHRALKSGCRVESRQFRSAKRLEVMTGVLSVTAIRLLQLRSMARTEPDRPARELIPLRWIEMLQKGGKRPISTVSGFFRSLAQLGGFLARKRDGQPGWITLWRGFEKLQLMLRGAAIEGQRSG